MHPWQVFNNRSAPLVIHVRKAYSGGSLEAVAEEVVVRYAAIVDAYHIPYGDMRGYASAFRDRGVEPIAIMSTPEPAAPFLPRWFPDDFAAVHYFDGDLPALISQVRSYQPICIIPGNEVGVELTAALVENIMPDKGNLPGSAIWQRDKGEMVRALERAGVPRLRTIRSADPQAISDWIADNELTDKPLVVKPPKSGGTDGVHFVGPGKEWRPYFDKLLGTVNDLGLINDEIIVQEYAAGTEYIVNMYSVDGQHGVVDICKYTKHDRGAHIGIYDAMDYLAWDAPHTAELVAYAKQAATALGIRNGPTHIELKRTVDGPRLIELAARHAGGPSMLAGRLASGDNQMFRAVRHHLDGTFRPDYELIQPLRVAHLSAASACTVSEIELLAEARQLPTVIELSLPPNGKQMPKTEDLHTSLGWIIQAAADWPTIEADDRRIRELEREWNSRQVGVGD